MPRFDTPSPIDLAINLSVGSIEVIASDRSDTVISILPTNPEKPVDVRGAQDTTVDFDGERLVIKGPKPRLSWIGPTESIDITIEVPTGSRLTAELAVGPVRSRGRLGATRVKASTGTIDLESTGDLWLRAAHGNATMATIAGTAEITADHGQIRIGTVTGDATLKASHGSVTIGESGGDIDAKLSYGDVELRRALGSVSATTAYGSIRVLDVSVGSVTLDTAFGAIVVGVTPGVSAWLDVASKEGRVRNELEGESAPAGSEKTVEVRARTKFGDITIQRAALAEGVQA